MANVSITLSGITEALENLNYRPGSVKDKAIRAISAYYVSEDSIQHILSIDGESIIRQIWDVGDDPAKIKSKRRNFSSLKSSINADLKKLSTNGLNPEDITLTESNVFDMTEDAKSSLLQSFSDAVKTDEFDLTKAADVLNAVAEFLDKIKSPDIENESTDIIKEIKKVLDRLAAGIFDGREGTGRDGDGALEGDVEIEEIDKDVEIENVDEDLLDEQLEEIDDDVEIEETNDDELEEVEEIDEDQQIEDIEVDGDEEREEVDKGLLDGQLEEIDDDVEIEETNDDELEEVEEIDEDQQIEDIEVDGDEEREEVDKGLLDGQLEEIDDDVEIEEINDDELEEVEEIDEDQQIEDIEVDGDEEREEVDKGLLDGQLEEIDDDVEIEEINDDELEEVEEIDEDQQIEDIEVDGDEEREEVDKDLLDGQLEEIDDDVEIEEINDDELEEVEEIDEDQQIEDIEVDGDEEREEVDKGLLDGQLEEIDDDVEIEEINDDELEEVEEIDEDQQVEDIEVDGDEEREEVDRGLLDGQLEEIDDDVEIEETNDDELEEVEEIDEDQQIEDIEVDGGEELEAIDDDVEIEETNDDELEEVEEIDEDQQIEDIELDEDEDLEELEEIDEDTEIEDVELDDDESLDEIEDIELDEDQELEEVDLGEDEDLEELDELDEEELKALEEFRNARELAEHFDDFLGEREKKFNAYIIIPAGTYTIGTEKSLKSSLALQPFDMPKVYMGKYPVTNALFEIFIEQTGYVTTAERKGVGTVYHSRFKKQGEKVTWSKQAGSSIVKGACWYQPSGPGSTLYGKRNHPVVQISVDDAFAYASWIGRRLPTEAEWEAAARTDMALKYPWSNQFDPDALNIESSGLADTNPVDDYDHAANIFGITDMLGNVMEWTADTQSPPFATRKAQLFNVAKGGAWNAKDSVTISSRGLFPPDTTANIIGFRCISELFQ